MDDALRSDPALEEELELITSLFDGETRRVFWCAFAEGCARRRRPAAAVLDSLERAAAGGSRGAGRGTTGLLG